MTEPLFESLERDGACLSDYRVSLVAVGDETLDAAMADHVRTCEACTRRLDVERQQLRDQVYEPLPKALLPGRKTDRTRVRLAGWVASASAVAIAAYAVLLPPAHEGRVRLKGGEASLSVTVQRDGQTLLDDQPLEGMHVLRQGDHMRFRLAGDRSPWVVVQGMEKGAWVTYFKGAPPADGWLPMAIELTDEGQTRLRLLTCNQSLDETREDVSSVCVERLFTL